MRKSIVVAVAAALALTVAAVALADGVVTQTIQAGVSPSKAGTTKKPKPITLKLHLSTTTSDGTKPPAANPVAVPE